MTLGRDSGALRLVVLPVAVLVVVLASNTTTTASAAPTNDYDRASTNAPCASRSMAHTSGRSRSDRTNSAHLSGLAGFAGFLAAKAGAAPVRLGQAGERAVREAYDIGPKVPVTIGGRTRIPDALTSTTLSEIKNVASLTYTRQLREYAQYAQQTGRTFDLYVRHGTSISGPLQRAADLGELQIIRALP